MEVVISQRTCGSSYVSSTPSSGRVSFNSHPDDYFSLPASPTTGLMISSFSITKELEKNCEDCSDLDYFEFDISQHFQSLRDEEQQEEKPQEGRASLSMSFADDQLFCDGQVLPLKLPPRLQYSQCTKHRNRKSNAAVLTKSKSLLSKRPFHIWSFRKNEPKDFDPFKVALEHVRKETSASDMASPHRRARSLSPKRTPPSPDWTQCNKSPGRVEHENQPPTSQQNQPSSTQQHNLQNKPGNGEPTKPDPLTFSGSTLKAEPSIDIKRSRSYLKEFRRLGSVRLFRSATEGRADSKDKLRPHTAALTKHSSFKKVVSGRKRNNTSCVLSCFSFGEKHQMDN
ncbi:hypothetical protein Sjap_001871 [Stephania japonica]|uniref:Uncharacterized protein n=1 Tax=Stephania japonica TaxID=461633 RepID=A0AAP0PVH9_9MAGN